MDELGEYRIPFEGLKVGEHHYMFELGDTFFEHFKGTQIERARLSVPVVLDRKANMLVFAISIGGSIDTVCDRCQGELAASVVGSFELVVKFGPERKETEDDILILGPAEHEVDLAQYLYEFAHLALPSRFVHENPEDCDPEVVDYLDFGDDEPESIDGSDQEEIDPRWDALKKLSGEN